MGRGRADPQGSRRWSAGGSTQPIDCSFGLQAALTTETQSEKLRDGFGAASVLHVNFYEGWLDRSSVANYLDRVREFVTEAEALLNGR